MADKRHPNPNDGGRDQYKRHVDGDISVRGQLEVHAPPDIAKAENTDREDQQSHRKKNFLMSLLTLLAVIIYSGLAAWQGCLTRRISTVSQKEYEFAKAQQRSLVQVTLDMSSMTNESFKTFEIPFQIDNLGKFTASKIIIRTRIEVPPIHTEPSFDLANQTAVMTHVPLYPGGKDSNLAATSTENGSLQKVPEFIRQELADGKRYVVMFGRIDYEDRLGHWWTQFCGWRPLVTHETPGEKWANAARCIDFNVDGGTPNKE